MKSDLRLERLIVAMDNLVRKHRLGQSEPKDLDMVRIALEHYEDCERHRALVEAQQGPLGTQIARRA